MNKCDSYVKDVFKKIEDLIEGYWGHRSCLLYQFKQRTGSQSCQTVLQNS